MEMLLITRLVTIIFGLFLVNIGIQHFRDPEWFEPIVPSVLGNPKFWVYLSGVFEIIFGIMILIEPLRKYGSLGISLMLIVLYWANLNMWINDIPIGGVKLNFFEHFMRGIIQILLILLALYIGRWPPFAKDI
ncbi:MAG: hypothetical protein CBC89_03070 [Euryarchaeota archaeon TMED129]|nr:MAG: hypothetical protein CBC89_03070 [Euryarchaeota archaeon TMED129]